MKDKKRAKYIRRQKEQKQKKILLFCLLIFSLMAGILWGVQESGEEIQESRVKNGEVLEVHFIDVGQGDATLIKCGEHAMLIDAGDNSKGTALQLYLKKQGVERLDYLIGTHPDADHIGGLDVIITKFDCDRVIMPQVERDTASFRDVVMAMEYKEYENTPPEPGMTYQLGNAVFTIIGPNGSYEDNYNNDSVAIILAYGSTRFIFTGDAESEAEADILAAGIDLKADVLKVGHHGSSDSTSEAFLEAVSPSFAVISCGEGNPYGHPHQRTLNALRKQEISVYRTDEQGSIIALSDGKEISWNCAPSESWKSGWREEQ